MFVKCFAGAIVGIKAVKVDVEVNVAGGGIGLFLVGLPDNAVKESEQRIRSAFENSQRRMTAKKVVVNLAPADLRKEGSGFDLPIAVGILAATQQVLDIFRLIRLLLIRFCGRLKLLPFQLGHLYELLFRFQKQPNHHNTMLHMTIVS